MSNLDKKKAVIMALIDFSKAYNRQCHNRLITCFNDLETPSYLLKVMASYLENRKMVVRHKGSISKSCNMPGGGPQGTNLGILSYLVNINSCGAPLDSIVNCIQNILSEKENLHPVLPLPPPHITDNSARFKYIDDMSLCQSVNLKDLESRVEPIERPLNYRDRTMHYLPRDKNILQQNMNDVHKFCEIQKFVINERKTQTVVFNTAISKDFSPSILNQQGNYYKNTESFKLLGVDFETNKRKGINLDKYVNKCIQKGY